ncbi:hypothetical protein F4809DRAFT_665450 [Biscogniauxia mediterranea]|nr:hypothetical protein F4809DRAFT_665450 [Biscogniauxia mediterranea]
MRPDNIVAGSFGEGMPPLRLDGLRRHPDVTKGENFGQLRKNRHHDDEGFEEIIQLLRRTPRPENFMSIPDNFSSSEEEKRRKFRLFRKARKPKKSRPPTIKLPDSAVAARTTDGHRYIAISIPVEHSYLGPNFSLSPKTNGPAKTSANRETPPRFDRKAPIDRPITFLKSVAEDKESSSSLSPGTSPCIEQPPSNTCPTEFQSTSIAQPCEHPSLQNKESHQIIGGHSNDNSQFRNGNESQTIDPTQPEDDPISTVKQPESDVSDVKNVTQMFEVPQAERTEKRSKSMDLPRRRNEKTEHEGSSKDEPNRGSGASTPMIISSTNPAIKLALPSRSSSKEAKTSTRGEQKAETPINNNRRISAGCIVNLNEINDNFMPRGSFAESLLTTESSPKLLKAETARAYHTIPIVVASAPQYHIASPLDHDFPEPPSRRVSRSVQTDLPEETKSGEDHINESDLEEMDEYRTPIIDEQATKDTTENEHGQSSNDIIPPLLHNRPRPDSERPDIAPINATPGTMPGTQPTTQNLTPTAIRDKQKETHMDTPFASVGRLLSTRNCSFLPHSYIPARSSSYRRAEKKEVERERERKQTSKARHIAKTLAEPKETSEKLSHQQLLDRYESLKETYIYDMEKRQRRLERNVECLVRSLGPFLENINRRLEEQQALQRENYSAYYPPPGASSSAARPRPRPRPRPKDQPPPPPPPPPADASSSHPRSVPDLINLFDTQRSQSFHEREPRRARHRPMSLQLGDHHHHHARRSKQQQQPPQARGGSSSTRQAGQPIAAADANTGDIQQQQQQQQQQQDDNPLCVEFEREIEQRWFNGRPPPPAGARAAGQEQQQHNDDNDNDNENSNWRRSFSLLGLGDHHHHHHHHHDAMSEEEEDDDDDDDEGEISDDAGPARPGTISPMIRDLQGTATAAPRRRGGERGDDTEEEEEEEEDEEEDSGEREEFDNICKAFARF